MTCACRGVQRPRYTSRDGIETSVNTGSPLLHVPPVAHVHWPHAREGSHELFKFLTHEEHAPSPFPEGNLSSLHHFAHCLGRTPKENSRFVCIEIVFHTLLIFDNVFLCFAPCSPHLPVGSWPSICQADDCSYAVQIRRQVPKVFSARCGYGRGVCRISPTHHKALLSLSRSAQPADFCSGYYVRMSRRILRMQDVNGLRVADVES